MDAILNFLEQTGFYMLFGKIAENWTMLVMIGISCVLLYLAIVKKFEPLLLLTIAFGMLLTNLPGAEMFHSVIFDGGHVNWTMMSGATYINTADIVDTYKASVQVLQSGDVIAYVGNGAYKIGTLAGLSLDQNALINAAGQLVSKAGDVLAQNANIMVDFTGSFVKDGVWYLGDGFAFANSVSNVSAGLLDYLYLGVKLGIYPCLIFFGVGAMTDFEPLIANPISLMLGAAAQLGIFITFIAAKYMGFTGAQAAATAIIGGADGPTAIYVTGKLAPELLGPIAVAAYSYMALVPVIQPPIMKLLTTKKERAIVMKPLRKVSTREKILFPIIITIFVALLVPSAAPLVGALMLGNLFKQSGVTERLSKTVQNELMNIVTIFLGLTVGATATAKNFLNLQTLGILVIGVLAFGIGTAGGVLLAKFMNLFLKNKINPLIGSAGVSAVPMAARVSQTVGQKENPGNFLLMHAMGPNVAGVIGSAIAAGVLIAIFA